MKNLKIILLITTITTLSLSCVSNEEKKLKLYGTIANVDAKSVLLSKIEESALNGEGIEIPIENGTFYYETTLEHPEMVELYLGNIKEKGIGSFVPLFLENETIHINIPSEELYSEAEVVGGKINSEYQLFIKKGKELFSERSLPLETELDELYENDEYLSPEANALIEQIENKEGKERMLIFRQLDKLKKEGKYLSEKATVLDSQLKAISLEANEFRLNYMKENPTLVTYYFLLTDLLFRKEQVDIQEYKKIYKSLEKSNFTSPYYNNMIAEIINAMENIKVGNQFVDFSATDQKGDLQQFSKLAKGKIVLLDLWATWCGSCIAKTRAMIPVYEEFKSENFTIISVAGERKSTENWLDFLEKEKWEWIQLVEVDKQYNIRQKYAADNKAGAMFLIDENGIIVAIDPTEEDVRIFLKNKNKISLQ